MARSAKRSAARVKSARKSQPAQRKPASARKAPARGLLSRGKSAASRGAKTTRVTAAAKKSPVRKSPARKAAPRKPAARKSKRVQPVPEGYGNVTSYLIVRDGAEALDFYSQAFGGEERVRMPQPDGRIGHAEMLIGDSMIMLADEFPERGIHGPETLNGSPVSFMLYVEDVDDVVERALEAGATLVEPITVKFYGDRVGRVRDPFGHTWSIGTHVEDVPPDEMRRRMEAAQE